MIVELRPGYIFPSRDTLERSLLDEVSAEVETTANKSKLARKKVTLVEDGWCQVLNDPIIATCLHVSDGKTFLFDAIDNKANLKNAEYH